jgi:tryptophanyl-tRNA synthetase
LGHAKQELFEVMNSKLRPYRESFEQLMAEPSHINSVLKQGSDKARELASAKIRDLRKILGID